jgi:hypothetical protein
VIFNGADFTDFFYYFRQLNRTVTSLGVVLFLKNRKARSWYIVEIFLNFDCLVSYWYGQV